MAGSDRSREIGPAGGPAKPSGAEEPEQTTESQQEQFIEALSGKVPRSLLEAVVDKGERLIEEPDRHRLQEYRESVKNLLDRVLEEAASVRSEVGLDSGGQLFSSVAKVDQKLLELTDEVLQEQGEKVKIARIVEQIKGLLVDLVR